MADIEKLKASIAKVKALTGKEKAPTVVKTTTETTTRAELEEVPEYPLNQD